MGVKNAVWMHCVCTLFFVPDLIVQGSLALKQVYFELEMIWLFLQDTQFFSTFMNESSWDQGSLFSNKLLVRQCT